MPFIHSVYCARVFTSLRGEAWVENVASTLQNALQLSQPLPVSQASKNFSAMPVNEPMAILPLMRCAPRLAFLAYLEQTRTIIAACVYLCWMARRWFVPAQGVHKRNVCLAVSGDVSGYALTFYTLGCICRSQRYEENRR